MNRDNLKRVRDYMSQLPSNRIDMRDLWCAVDGVASSEGETVDFFKGDCGAGFPMIGYTSVRLTK